MPTGQCPLKSFTGSRTAPHRVVQRTQSIWASALRGAQL